MEKSSNAFETKASQIKVFLTDIDGSLTDGKVFYSAAGEELKSFNLKDGTGFYLLRKAGIIAGIITGENSAIVKKRAEKLNLNICHLGILDKKEVVLKICNDLNISINEIAYLGDDLNDYCLTGIVGIFFCPSDACFEIKKRADYVCDKKGGDGAFREAVEILLQSRGDSIIDVFKNNEPILLKDS